MYSKLALVLALASAPLAAALSSGAGSISPGGGNRLDSTSDAVCTQAYNWANNSLGQDPCEVAANVISVCVDGGYVHNLPSCEEYNIPQPGSALTPTTCVCSTVYYELISACAGCQGKPYSTFSDFSIYCPSENITYGNFPLPVPSGTDIPSWAYQSPKDNNGWYNAPLAQKIGDKPENTRLSKPTGVSNYSPPKPSCSGGPANDLGGTSSKKTSTAAIAGGVVGGVVAVGAIGAIAVLVVGKMGATAGMGAAASAGTAGGGGGASGAGTGFGAGMGAGHSAGTAFGGAHAGAAAYGGAQAPWAAHGAGMAAPGAQAPFAGQAAGGGAAYGGASASVGPGAVASPGVSAGFTSGGVTASGIPMGAAAPMGPGVGGAGAAIGPASYGGATHGVTYGAAGGSGAIIGGTVGAAGATSVWGKLFGATRRTRRDVEQAGQGYGPNMSTTNADTFGLLNAPGPGPGLPQQQQSPYPTPSNITYSSQGSPGIPQQGTPSGTPLQSPQQLPSTQTPYYQSYFSGAQPGTPGTPA